MKASIEDPLADLMVRYQAGDQSASERIYYLTVNAVERYLELWADSARHADLVEETYLQVHRARRTYRPQLPFRPWLFAIARHVGSSAPRSRRRRWSREVIWLSKVEGMSSSEIAKAIGISQWTINLRLHRVNQKLRSQFDSIRPGTGRNISVR